MTFKSKIECDASGCFNERDLDCCHPADAEIEIEHRPNGWLCIFNNHYCPSHARQAADEVGVEYDSKQ